LSRGHKKRHFKRRKVRVALDFMKKVIYVDYRHDSFQPENGKKTCLECFACPWRPGYGRPVRESKLFEVFSFHRQKWSARINFSKEEIE
jgi:hypothetical protein